LTHTKTTVQNPNSQATLSDHPVLEFLNTKPVGEGRLREQLQSDVDVLSTLNRLGWIINFEGTGLLAPAIELREEIRRLVTCRKEGNPLNPATLNQFLSEGASHVKLLKSKDGSLTVDRAWESGTPRQVLAPLAEAAAGLLANGDFSLIRRCESEQCVLWFYDRTKSHHRRWCSMTSCGNRHKVAAFRQRQQQSNASHDANEKKII
jgi:predicted RNA-binding Zn ribbon-like protein